MNGDFGAAARLSLAPKELLDVAFHWLDLPDPGTFAASSPPIIYTLLEALNTFLFVTFSYRFF